MNKDLIILRGVSGSGKSTVAMLLAYEGNIFEADDYFRDQYGNYEFNPEDLYAAHKECQQKVLIAMGYGFSPIVVSNTSTTEKELKPYIDMANKNGYAVTVLVVENRHGGKDIHNVPEETLVRQEKNLRNSIKLR